MGAVQRRNLQLIATFRAVSVAGDEVALLALQVRLAHHGHYAGYLIAALSIANMLPIVLLAPVAGWIVDRTSAKRLIVPLGVVAALVSAALAEWTNPAATIGLVALLGCTVAITVPGFSVLLPAVIGEEHIVRAQGTTQATTGIASMLGPVIGGLLVALTGQRWPLVVDAMSFVVLAVGTTLVRGDRVPAGERPPRARGDLSAGVRFLVRDPVLAPMVGVVTLVILSLGMVNVALIFLVIAVLHGSTFVYGIVGACFGAGMIGGGVTASRVPQRAQPLVRIVFGGAGILGLLIAVAGTLPSVGYLYAPVIIVGVVNTWVNVAAFTLFTIRSPEAIRGRVFAAVNAVFTGVQVLSMGLGGVLVTTVGTRSTLELGAVISVLTVIVLAPIGLRATRKGAAADVPATAPAS